MDQMDSNVSSIYVGNVPWKATKEEIGDLISTAANVEVADVRIIKEKGTGRSRGFAFVDILHPDPQIFIDNAPEVTLQGRTLYFRDAKPKEQKEDDIKTENPDIEINFNKETIEEKVPEEIY